MLALQLPTVEYRCFRIVRTWFPRSAPPLGSLPPVIREVGRERMPPLPDTKKPWSKPELIVLVRGRPEEAILNACKGNGLVNLSSDDDNTGCSAIPLCTSDCNALGSS